MAGPPRGLGIRKRWEGQPSLTFALAYRMKPHRPFVWLVVLVWLLPHVSGKTAEPSKILEASLEAFVISGHHLRPTNEGQLRYYSTASLDSALERRRPGDLSDRRWAYYFAVTGLVFRVQSPAAYRGKELTMHIRCSGPPRDDTLDLFQIGRRYRMEVGLTNIGRPDFTLCAYRTHWKEIKSAGMQTSVTVDTRSTVLLTCEVECYVSRISTIHIWSESMRYYHDPADIKIPGWDPELDGPELSMDLESKAIAVSLDGVILKVPSPATYAGRRLCLHHGGRCCPPSDTNVLSLFPWQEAVEVRAPEGEIGCEDFLLGTHAVTVRRLTLREGDLANQSSQATAATRLDMERPR